MKINNKIRHFVNILEEVATQSKCLKRKVGALIVKNDMLLSTGYNGPVRGAKHCKEYGCSRQSGNDESCRAVHAEQNAIINAITTKADIHGAICYCTYKPCGTCIKLLKAAGISAVYYIVERDNEFAVERAIECGVILHKLED